MLVPRLASLHTDPHPGTKCISISDVRGIAAYDPLRFVPWLYCALSSRISRCFELPDERGYGGPGVVSLDLIVDLDRDVLAPQPGSFHSLSIYPSY